MNTTFKTDLNYQQVDVMNVVQEGPEYNFYTARISWGVNIVENMRELDILPFIDRIEIECGDSPNTSNHTLIVKHDFLDIINDESTKYRVKFHFLRESDFPRITVRPKFIGIDMETKTVEVLFDA